MTVLGVDEQVQSEYHRAIAGILKWYNSISHFSVLYGAEDVCNVDSWLQVILVCGED